MRDEPKSTMTDTVYEKIFNIIKDAKVLRYNPQTYESETYNQTAGLEFTIESGRTKDESLLFQIKTKTQPQVELDQDTKEVIGDTGYAFDTLDLSETGSRIINTMNDKAKNINGLAGIIKHITPNRKSPGRLFLLSLIRVIRKQVSVGLPLSCESVSLGCYEALTSTFDKVIYNKKRPAAIENNEAKRIILKYNMPIRALVYKLKQANVCASTDNEEFDCEENIELIIDAADNLSHGYEDFKEQFVKETEGFSTEETALALEIIKDCYCLQGINYKLTLAEYLNKVLKDLRKNRNEQVNPITAITNTVRSILIECEELDDHPMVY